MALDLFLLRNAGAIRESLIILEGDDGSFKLVTHGTMPSREHDDATVYVIVR